MPTTTELERLAAAAHALRPDWPLQSLLTRLTRHHAHTAYRDLAVALAWVATDPDTKTPARLTEDGPWWHATTTPDVTRTPPRRIPCDRHGFPGTDLRCEKCIAETATPEQVRAIRAGLIECTHDWSGPLLTYLDGREVPTCIVCFATREETTA